MPNPLPSELTVPPLGSFEQTLRLPGSKSLTNRALLLAALAEGKSVLRGVLDADDTRRMIEALRGLGLRLEVDWHESRVTVHGQGGCLRQTQAQLDLGNAGTAIRPLTAACCLGQGTYRLDGDPRMRQRPIGQLVDALGQLGAQITYLGNPGYPPLDIQAHGLQGGRLTMKPTLSSQFITALLMAAPAMQRGLGLDFDGPITSRPYVELTLGLMRRFGIQPRVDPNWAWITVDPGTYQAVDYTVEPDASNATYFLAAAAGIPGSRCTIEGLGRSSLQGDSRFVEVLQAMGARVQCDDDSVTVRPPPDNQTLRGIDVDLNHMPDAAMTLAAIAPIAEGPTTIGNIGNWRVKETDRLAAMKTELEKVGASVTITGQGNREDMTITPPPTGRLLSPPAGLDTYNDHRMAMSLATLALIAGPLTINDPTCVNKTFPSFWQTLENLRSGEVWTK